MKQLTLPVSCEKSSCLHRCKKKNENKTKKTVKKKQRHKKQSKKRKEKKMKQQIRTCRERTKEKIIVLKNQ